MELGTLALRWERRLEREGLGALDVPYGNRPDIEPARQATIASNRGRRARPDPRSAPTIALAEAAETWLTWAREVSESFRFTSYRQRRIWSLYSDALPLTQINKLVGGSRRSITKAIRRITLANPPPIPNPWRLSGRDLTPLRLVPREDEDMAAPTTRPILQYKQIKMRRGFAQTLPGNPREKDVLLNVEGRPTPWGIDLVLDGGVVLSLPAWKIDHALQVPEV